MHRIFLVYPYTEYQTKKLKFKKIKKMKSTKLVWFLAFRYLCPHPYGTPKLDLSFCDIEFKYSIDYKKQNNKKKKQSGLVVA